MFYQDLLSPLGMGQRVRRGHSRWFATELGVRLGTGLRGRGGGGAILKVDITNTQAGVHYRLKSRGTVA